LGPQRGGMSVGHVGGHCFIDIPPIGSKTGEPSWHFLPLAVMIDLRKEVMGMTVLGLERSRKVS